MIELTPSIYNLLQRFAHGDYKRQAAVIGGLGLPKTARVVEIGCGTGLMSRFFEPGTYVGLDSDASRIETARATYPGHEFRVADTTKMMGADFVEFDMALCHGVVHHIDDEGVARMVQSFRAAAKQRSKAFAFLAIEPVMPSPPFTNPVGYLLAKLDRGQHVRSMTQWRALFGEAITKIEVLPPPVQWPVPGAAIHLLYGDR